MSHFYRNLLLNAKISINTENKTIDVRYRKQDLPKHFVDQLIPAIGSSFTLFDLRPSATAYDRRYGQAYEIDFSWHDPKNPAEGFSVTVKGDHVLTTNDLIHVVSKSYEILSKNEGFYLWELHISEWDGFYQPIFPELQAKIKSDNFIRSLLLLSCYHDVGKKLPLDIWVKITGYFNNSISEAELKSIVRKEREIIRQSAELNVEFGLFKANSHFGRKLQESFLENNRHRSPQHQHEYDKRFGLTTL